MQLVPYTVKMARNISDKLCFVKISFDAFFKLKKNLYLFIYATLIDFNSSGLNSEKEFVCVCVGFISKGILPLAKIMALKVLFPKLWVK